MEYVVYSLFRVDIENLVRNKVHIAKNFHISPSEIEQLPYWEYEYMMKEMTDTIKKENEDHKKQEEQYGDINSRVSKMQRNGVQTPKMPSMPSISMPKI